jgi:uncharacterized membrane protein YphA (DoxX/SURF4 family)
MHDVLRTLQVMLAATFLTAGIMKTTQPKEKLAANVPWVAEFSPRVLKFLGAIELVGALGLALPDAFGIGAVWTPLSAIGVVLMMSCALIFHTRRREHFQAGITGTILVAAAIIAWLRLGPYGS